MWCRLDEYALNTGLQLEEFADHSAPQSQIVASSATDESFGQHLYGRSEGVRLNPAEDIASLSESQRQLTIASPDTSSSDHGLAAEMDEAPRYRAQRQAFPRPGPETKPTITELQLERRGTKDPMSRLQEYIIIKLVYRRRPLSPED